MRYNRIGQRGNNQKWGEPIKTLIRKISSWVLVLSIVCSMTAIPVFAANGERYSVTSTSQHNQEILDKKAELEEWYGIAIKYPSYLLEGEETAAIYLETLQTLDTALSYVSPYVVRQVSAHYYNLNGKRLRFSYKFADLIGTDEIIVGGFDPEQSLVELYIPSTGRGAVITGDAPLTIVHEFGHAVQVMIASKYGENKMTNEWTGLNGQYAYVVSNFAQNPNDRVFISDYAATAFSEDFAETFAHAFACNRTGMGFSSKLGTNSDPTALGKKVNYLYQLLSTYFPDSTKFLNNYQQLYNVSSTLTYNGLTLSGSFLQFIGYDEPRYMPLTAFELFPEVKESRYKWISNIGAWYAYREGQDNVVIFPGGNWGTTSSAVA